MTQDEIIEMFRQHFLRVEYDNGNVHERYEVLLEELEAFAKLVAAKAGDEQYSLGWLDGNAAGIREGSEDEREACAKVCEQTDDGTPYNLAEACAKAIRARGQE